MTYARVAVDAQPRFPHFRPVEDGVTGFLGDHITSLFAMAKTPDATPPGRFREAAAQTLFRALHTGSDEEFLASADTLTRRLIGRMNRTTAEGLLICVRAETAADGRVAGVLKLQVVAPNAAVLRALDSGDVVLTAVTDLLDSPGDLQKGALVASSLPAGQVLCGDRVAHMARYFPEAFDIQIYCRPSVATRAFFDAVEEFAAPLLPQVAEAWATVRPGSARDVLAELGQKVPELTALVQADIAERLETAARPVALLDTRRPVKETLQAGEITLSGPIDVMRRLVHVAEQPDGGWRVTLDSIDRPLPSHQ
ncbi:MAG TPA: hypothetical protein VH912_10290 [Streptosporangiaceae bacterium]|jgi:hypothetical protein